MVQIQQVKRYPVIEIFGPTIQGEGAVAGTFTHFVRLGGCDYRCLWCDSDHAVLPAKVRQNATKMSVTEVVDALVALPGKPGWVTISGGNPALHDLELLVNNLHYMGFKVAVETQGTIWRDWLNLVDQLTISPKPPSSGMAELSSIHNMKEFAGKVRASSNPCIKVPVFNEADYEFAVRIHEIWSWIPFYFSIVTRMGGLYGDFDGGTIDTKDDILRRYKWLVERAASDARVGDARALPQLHVLVWEHERQR